MYISETETHTHTHTYIYRITAELLLITIATRHVKCLALALTSGTLVWQEIMTTSPTSDLLFGENNL